jgi:hypothetical protein
LGVDEEVEVGWIGGEVPLKLDSLAKLSYKKLQDQVSGGSATVKIIDRTKPTNAAKKSTTQVTGTINLQQLNLAPRKAANMARALKAMTTP